MMAAEIQTDPEWGVKPPKVLFSGNLNVTWFPTYDVAPDGRFLMLREGESAKILEPLSRSSWSRTGSRS